MAEVVVCRCPLVVAEARMVIHAGRVPVRYSTIG